MTRKRTHPLTIHLPLTALDAATLAALAHARGVSQRQILRGALRLLDGQQPTAATAAAVIDERMAALTASLMARLDAVLRDAFLRHIAQQRDDLAVAIGTLIERLSGSAVRGIGAAASTTARTPPSIPHAPSATARTGG